MSDYAAAHAYLTVREQLEDDAASAREQLDRAAAMVDDVQAAHAAGRVSAVSPVEVARLRIELGTAYARLAARR